MHSNKSYLAEINGKLGVVRGKAENEEVPGLFSYAVRIMNSQGEFVEVWDVFEEDLLPTGKKANKADFETGVTIQVSVDPETGEGKIIDNDFE